MIPIKNLNENRAMNPTFKENAYHESEQPRGDFKRQREFRVADDI